MKIRIVLFSFCGLMGTAAAETKDKPDIELGAYLSGECVTCHVPGKENGAIPEITNLPFEAFVLAMQDYKEQIRENDVMQKVSSRLSDEEIAALAAYFESLETN